MVCYINTHGDSTVCIYIYVFYLTAHSQILGGLLKRDWKRRYFVLYQDGALVYYERAGAEQYDGRVSVRNGCQRIDYGYEVEKDAQQKSAGRVGCLFSIKTTQKSLFLLAESELDAL